MIKQLVAAIALVAAVSGVVGVSQPLTVSATENDCPVKESVDRKNIQTYTKKCVTPAAPTFTDLCEKKNDTFTIPATEGVKYWVKGQILPAGTYVAEDYDYMDTVYVVAFAERGYKLEGEHKWHHKYTDEKCKPNLSYVADCDVSKQAFVVTVKNTGDGEGEFTLNGTAEVVAPMTSETREVPTGSEGANVTLKVGDTTVIDNKRYVCVAGQGSVSTGSSKDDEKEATPVTVVQSLPNTGSGEATAALAVVAFTTFASAAGYIWNRRFAVSL